MFFEKVYIISNTRMLFISLLLSENKSFDESLLLMDGNIYSCFKLNNKYIILSNTSRNVFMRFILSLKINSIIRKLIRKNTFKNLEVFGADHILGAKYFLRRFPFYVLEDGTANYEPRSYKRSWKNRLFSIPVFGVYKNVKKIHLTQKENIPEIIKDKVEIVNINSLWAEKTDKEKEYILNIFNFNIKDVETLLKKKNILFTQPLSEDGILTEEEKISLYHKIISKYDISDLVIKPHPREKTDYKEVFKDIYVFKSNIPSELLELLNIRFDKVITLFSTAVLQYNQDQVDFYGTVCHSKLKEHFGDIRFFKVNSNL